MRYGSVGSRLRKAGAVALAGSLLAMSAPWAALADDIYNNLDTSVDAVAEVMNLTAGGAAGTTQLYVDTQNGDGKNGCNLTGSTTFVASVNSSNTGVATVSPSSVTFASCGEVKTLTVSPLAAGSTTISLAQTSNTTGGTFNLAPATFTVQVAAAPAAAPAPPPPADTTAPVITPNIVGVLGDNGWRRSDVSVSFTVEDGESTVTARSAACDTTTVIDTDTTGQTVTCEATSAGGTNSQPVTIKRDATAPSVVPADVIDSTWRRASLSEDFAAEDATSGLADAGDATFTLTAAAESAGASAPTVVSKTVSDNAGNTTTRQVSALIDLTAPVITRDASLDACALPGANGWCRGAQTAGFSASDALSGLAASDQASFTRTTSVNGSEVTIASGAVADVAGNSNAGLNAGPFKVDNVAPAIQLTGGPAAGGRYIVGGTPAAPTCAARDATSGVESCVVTGYGDTVGQHTLTATATDQAGNRATISRTYTVVYGLCVIGDAVRMSSTASAKVWKAGSVIPVKARACDASGVNLSDASIVVKAGGVGKVDSAVADVPAADAGNANPDANFRYDAELDGYIYNMSTRGLSTGTWRLTVTVDGASHPVYFDLK